VPDDAVEDDPEVGDADLDETDSWSDYADERS
jgi:hypothetical protein